MRIVALVVVLLALPVGTILPAGAQQPAGTLWTNAPRRRPGGPPLADLAARARPAVVHVRGIADEPPTPGERGGDAEGGKTSIGTGFIINKDGYVVTNEHVVRAVTDLRVRLYDGRELPACVVGADAPTDIALLKIEGAGALPVL